VAAQITTEMTEHATNAAATLAELKLTATFAAVRASWTTTTEASGENEIRTAAVFAVG
jgi:hypothetical protein